MSDNRAGERQVTDRGAADTYNAGFVAGVEDRARPHLTDDEMEQFIAAGDEWTRGYRDGLHG